MSSDRVDDNLGELAPGRGAWIPGDVLVILDASRVWLSRRRQNPQQPGLGLNIRGQIVAAEQSPRRRSWRG